LQDGVNPSLASVGTGYGGVARGRLVRPQNDESLSGCSPVRLVFSSLFLL
jgi:hypothetical protein